MSKKAILCVSFGTSHLDTLECTIAAIENSLRESYPTYEVRRAFTSNFIIKKLKTRDNIQIDTVTEALERLASEGFDTVVVQSTHVMGGIEYDLVVEKVAQFEGRFASLTIGKPLLTDDSDYEELTDGLAQYIGSARGEDTAMVFMGHGTDHDANETYTRLQGVMNDRGCPDFFIGTVEAEPTVEDVLEAVKASGRKNVIMRPLMIVAGDHAKNDMAGDEDDSWKSIFTAAGFNVQCVTEGLGQIGAMRTMFVKHAGEAMGE